MGLIVAPPVPSASPGAGEAQALFQEARRRRRRRWQAGGRVYWVDPVDPVGAFVPRLGHWSQLVKYLDLATGQIGTEGPGQTVFLSADGRYLLMSQTATSLTETPVTGGAVRAADPSARLVPARR